MAVVGTAGRGLIIYQLENQPQEFKRTESPLKYQVCSCIIQDTENTNYYINFIGLAVLKRITT